jgi:hypothetical protein
MYQTPSSRLSVLRRAVILVPILVAYLWGLVVSPVWGAAACAAAGKGNPLPLPSSLPLAEFEQQFFAFLQQRTYKTLGWERDTGIRDAGRQ